MDIIKFILGLLADKTRKSAANELKEGDVTDETFRSLIEREIDEIKWKLNGLARANLLASISFFKEGLVYLYKVLDMRRSEEDGSETTQGADGKEKVNLKVTLRSSAASTETVSIAKQMERLQLTGQDEPAARALSDAKKRFEDARRKATEAFCNEAPSTTDRILAMQFRLMATLLEKADGPSDALATCRLCLEELHSMPAVQKCFRAQFQQGVLTRMMWFNKGEREEIICSVCRLNRAVYDVAQMVGESVNLLFWPCVDIGEEKVDPLRDSRVMETLQKLGMEQLFVTPRSFGQEGEEEHRLKGACNITTNTQGQYIVVDWGARDIKVFHSSGKCLYSSRSPIDVICMDADTDRRWSICGIVTDREDNIYILNTCWKLCDMAYGVIQSTMYVFDKHMNLHHKYNVKIGEHGYSIAVNDNNKMFVLRVDSDVQVYNTNGDFLRSFGNEIFQKLQKHEEWNASITAANDGCVMVLDHFFCVHVFSEQGDHLSQLTLNKVSLGSGNLIGFHRSSEHVVVLNFTLFLGEPFNKRVLLVYTKDGVLVRRIQLPLEFRNWIPSFSFAVSEEGHVAIFDFLSSSIHLIE